LRNIGRATLVDWKEDHFKQYDDPTKMTERQRIADITDLRVHLEEVLKNKE